jgi:hypothetical protein
MISFEIAANSDGCVRFEIPVVVEVKVGAPIRRPAPLTPKTQPRSKSQWIQAPIRPLPVTGQQLQILNFLFRQQLTMGMSFTRRLKKHEIADAIGAAVPSINTQLQRLRQAGLLVFAHVRSGRGDAGTIFRVPAHVAEALRAQ